MNSRFLFFISFFFLLIFLHCTKIGRAYFLNGLDAPLPEVIDLTINRNSSGITLAWKNPASRGRNIYNKALILKNTSAIQDFPKHWRDYPVSTTMGVSRVVYNAAAPTFRDTEVVEDVVYFYKVFVSDTYLYYNFGVQTKVNKYIPPPADTQSPAEVSDVTFRDLLNVITWINPADADFSKVLILRDTISIIDGPSAGEEYIVDASIGTSRVVYNANSPDFSVRAATAGTLYFYKIFAYDASRNYAAGVEISATKNTNKTIFVNAAGGASGSSDGTSWSNAFSDLSSALTSSTATAATSALPVQIVVAAGVYKPTSLVSDRDATFQLISHVRVYGGFSGTETSLSERNWRVNKPILSGDLGGDDTVNAAGVTENADDIKGTEMADAGGMMTVIANNSYTVVTGASDAILDGFTITAGQSNGPTGTFNHTNRGGGVYNIDNHNLTLTNITFSGNAAGGGGGVYSRNSNNLILTNILFFGNTASNLGGGGLTNFRSSAILTNVAFSGNMAPFGGGTRSTHANLTLTNVVFSNNTATADGGGGSSIYGAGSIILINVIMWGNTAGTCTGANSRGNQNICSSKLSGDTRTINISHSLIQGCGVSGSTWATGVSSCGDDNDGDDSTGNNGDGGNNIDGDPTAAGYANYPMFVDADGADNVVGTLDDNLRLNTGSPAIDVGSTADNGGLPAEITTDLAGNPRIVNDRIDMGAYEGQ